MEVQADRASAPEEALILAHYERAAPLAKNFPLAPLIVTYYPHGLDEGATFYRQADALRRQIFGKRAA